MKKLIKCSVILSTCFLITGCSLSKDHDGSTESTTARTSVSIYDKLISGNEKYGSNKEQICESNFKCSPDEIQENVIIAPTWGVDIFDDSVENIRHISGPTGHGYDINELTVGGEKITHITTGVGACNLIDAVLALGCTPCKNIIFIGSAGALDANMRIGDIVIPEYSICGVGADRYLTTDSVEQNDSYGKRYYPNKDFSEKVSQITDKAIENTDIKVYSGKVFSVDTIFAQYAHLDEIINMGCNVIEMETATFFHAADIAGIRAAAVFNISDNTLANKSLYSGRTDEEQQRRKIIKKDIIPRVALGALLK